MQKQRTEDKFESCPAAGVDPKDCPDLLTFRMRSRMTLRNLSKLSGLSISTLSRLENRIGKPTAKSIILLEDSLQIDRSDLERLLG